MALGYQIVKRYLRADGTPVWRIVYENYSGGERVQRHVPKAEWPAIGFSPTMTYTQAKERAEQLARLDWERFKERRRQQRDDKLSLEEKRPSRFLPDDLCETFTKKVLLEHVGARTTRTTANS